MYLGNSLSFILLLLLINTYSYAIDSLKGDSLSEEFIMSSSLSKIDRYNAFCLMAESSTDADTIFKYSSLAFDLASIYGLNPARSLVSLGVSYQDKGNLTKAVESFTKAASYFELDNKRVELAAVYTFISNTYTSQQNHANAKLYLHKAIQIFKEEGDSLKLASSLHNLGYEFYRVEKYDSALILFTNSSRVYQRLEYDRGFAYCIGNSGLVYSKLDKLDLAKRKLEEAINILADLGDERAVAEFINEYAYILQREGKILDAIQSSHKSLGLATANNITEIKRDATYRLAQIYQQKKQYDSAFYYQQLYHTYNDSIRNLETIQKTADLRTEFEVSQKQAEVDMLEKNRQLQRIIIGGLIFILILAGGLSIMIYLSLKRNRKLTRALENQKAKLEVQSKELQELNHIKDRFFSIISHDLRSPIASLSGISYLIKEGQKSDDKAILKEATDYIDQSVVTLTGLLENLLNWALSQQGKFPFREEQIDLKELIEEVVRIFASVALSKNQTIEKDLTPDLIISADKNTMMTVIRNLLSNATKFTEKEGHIRITSQKNNGNAEIIVSDEGIGIPEEKLGDIFKLKEDKSSRGTDNEKGLGLGLNLVHEFVTTNKGTIRVESKVGEGTSFYLHFPLIKS